jgi:hypothetical protein
MAAKKATTTDDLRNEQQIANDDQAAKVTELTDPGMVADVDAPKTVKVKSLTGAVTEVPQGIVDALLDSGYSKSN